MNTYLHDKAHVHITLIDLCVHDIGVTYCKFGTAQCFNEKRSQFLSNARSVQLNTVFLTQIAK